MYLGKLKLITKDSVLQRSEYRLLMCDISGKGFFYDEENCQHYLEDLDHDGIRYTIEYKDNVQVRTAAASRVAMDMVLSGSTLKDANQALFTATGQGFPAKSKKDFIGLCKTYIKIGSGQQETVDSTK